MKWRPYPAYKPSGVEWLGDVPEGWEVKRLKYLVSRKDEKVEADENNPLPYIGLEHIESWTGHLLPLNAELVPTGISNHFQAGDTLFGKLRPYLAKACNVDFEGLCSSELLVLRANGRDQRFFLYRLLAEGFIERVNASTYGAKMPRASWDFIGSCILPEPPIPEQTAIADFLDHETGRIDTLVAKKQTLIERLKDKRTALITALVTGKVRVERNDECGTMNDEKGNSDSSFIIHHSPFKMKPSGVEWLGDVPEHWEVKSIKRLTTVQRGASPRPIDNEIYFDDNGEYSWVRISDVTTAGMYLTSTTQRLSELGCSFSVPLEPGTLFLSIAGSVGKPCITKIKCCIHDGFVYFPHWRGEARFLYYVFASGEPYKGLGKLGTQLNLNTDTVGSILVGIPDKREQTAIADFLDRETAKIDRLIAKIETAIERLREYRTALITAAVTGKIDVRGAAS